MPTRLEVGLTSKSSVCAFDCLSRLPLGIPVSRPVSEDERKRSGSLRASYQRDAGQRYGKRVVWFVRAKEKRLHACDRQRIAGSRGVAESRIWEVPKPGSNRVFPQQEARACLDARAGCFPLPRIRTIRGCRDTSGAWLGCPHRSRPLPASRVHGGSSLR